MKIGIDPGLSGAIAFVSDTEIKVYDMPTIPIPWSRKGKRMVDTKFLHLLIEKKGHILNESIETITMEIVHSMPKQGVSSTWTFAGSFFSALAVINMFDHEIKMVHPAVWKKQFGLINMDKDASRLAVLKMYPDLISRLARKKDGGRAEAILIATSV